MKTNGAKLPPAMTFHLFPVPPGSHSKDPRVSTDIQLPLKHTLIKTKQCHQRRKANVFRFFFRAQEDLNSTNFLVGLMKEIMCFFTKKH